MWVSGIPDVSAFLHGICAQHNLLFRDGWGASCSVPVRTQEGKGAGRASPGSLGLPCCQAWPDSVSRSGVFLCPSSLPSPQCEWWWMQSDIMVTRGAFCANWGAAGHVAWRPVVLSFRLASSPRHVYTSLPRLPFTRQSSGAKTS